MRVDPVDEDLARRAGELLAATGTRDAVDAIVVASAARRGDDVVTSDRVDIARLAAHVSDVSVVKA
jgi:predicted nucleic acid-binding protein